jgi:hypothetical protein
MVDETPDDIGLAPDSGRAKRAPPTIELEATEISSEPAKEQAKADTQEPVQAQAEAAPQPEPEPEQPAVAAAPAARPISPWVVAPLSGAVAAALVIGVGWMLGWPPVQPADQATPQVPQVNASTIDALTARVAGLEAKLARPAAPASDPATAARIDALDKSVAALRGQSDKLAAAIAELKSAPRDGTAASVDLSAINERIAQLEQASRAQGAAAANAKPADDLPLRRLVAASLLDVAVRHSDPYQAALATAKSLSPHPEQLKPLDEFAATGVPMPFALNRELLTLVPKLTPSPPENATTGTSLVDKLQAGAARLVRIERTDSTGNDRAAVVSRVTAAALHNDLADARRELNTLSPADRAAAQGWLDKAAARDAALAASRQFADEAMAALAKPAQ